MKVSELKRLLNHPNKLDDDEVVVVLSEPSFGPIASSQVVSGGYGFDWDNGKFLLRTKENIVILKEKEALWQAAHDFIYQLSQEKTYKGNPTFLAKRAQKIIDRSKNKV